MQKRIKQVILILLGVVSVCVAYYICIKTMGFSVPCVFHSATGLYCAGCGTTRMLVALLELDFVEAAKNNIVILLLFIPTLIFVILKSIRYVRVGPSKITKAEKTCAILLIIILFSFTILRNLPQFSFLAPTGTL